MHRHLSVHFRQEEEELLLEVWWQGMEGPSVYQCTEVGVNKNGPRRLKIYLFPSIALHLPCGFWKQEEIRIFSLGGGGVPTEPLQSCRESLYKQKNMTPTHLWLASGNLSRGGQGPE